MAQQFVFLDRKASHVNLLVDSFIKSLAWVAVVVACALAFYLLAASVDVDFLGYRAHHMGGNLAMVLVFFIPFLSVIGFVGVALVFTVPQLLQMAMAAGLMRVYGRRGLVGIVLGLPLLSVVTWYCYDYLTPSNLNLAINTDGDWVPYQHGLNSARYWRTLLAQSAVTLFTLARLLMEQHDRKHMKTLLMSATLVAAACYGVVNAYQG